ncbi:MAG TPA: hypothetical protein VF220_04740 [Nitrososphaeraceae archaeon]
MVESRTWHRNRLLLTISILIVYDIYEIIKQDLHSNQTVLHVGGSLKPHTWLLCEVKQAQALKIY